MALTEKMSTAQTSSLIAILLINMLLMFFATIPQKDNVHS